MKKRQIAVGLLVLFCWWTASGVAHAAGENSLTRGAASLIVPGWGQYLNGELETTGGKIKTGVMILTEIAAIITTSVVGGVTGYPQIWVGIGLFIFNHVWSATDAYLNAPAGPEVALKESAARR